MRAAIVIADEVHELKPGDDRIRASTGNIARRRFRTIPSDGLIRETSICCGDRIATIIAGQDDLALLEVRLS